MFDDCFKSVSPVVLKCIKSFSKVFESFLFASKSSQLQHKHNDGVVCVWGGGGANLAPC